MRLLFASTVAAFVALSMSVPASAQSFLEGLARRRAADRAAAVAVERLESAASGGGDSRGYSQADRPVSGATDAPRAPARGRGPAPWPLNADEATYTGDLEFAPADEARKAGLHAFARVECMDCEGGYSFDSWIAHHVDMEVDEVAARVGALGVGGTLIWTGAEASGRLEVLSESPVGPFACKQVRTIMARGEATYETPGLYCFGKSHAYARAMWVEVL